MHHTFCSVSMHHTFCSVSMHHTFYGLVDLAKHLLQEENYEYVCLGMFSTDPLEKAFSKLGQGSGGTYFINAQQVTKKLRIQKAKLQITLDHSMVDSSAVRSHQCEDCNYDLKSDESNLLDELSSLEAFVNRETKINLVDIAGCVSRKNPPEVDEDMHLWLLWNVQWIHHGSWSRWSSCSRW